MASPASTNHDALAIALGEVLGPALVLDARRRVLAVTPAARELLPRTVHPGESTAELLGGRKGADQLAAALAAGQPASVVVQCSGRRDVVALRVRATPLGRAGASGWLLALSGVRGEAEAGGVVQFHGMWTQDPGMLRLFGIIEKVARTESRVLVRGETGSGKELVARAVHALSGRARGPFRAINCAALPANLLESELFGHVRGAFTGAVRDYPGHFRLAEGGTLFLDEVGEMPLDLQVKLLRVVETGTVIPVGGTQALPVDVRIVAATHRSLRAETAAGRFRADLMYRLRVVPVFLPPLRDRPGDVMLLAGRFLDELSRRGPRRIEHVSDDARRRLEAWSWPGNVRELRNVLEYAWVIGDGPTLLAADLPPELLEAAPRPAGADTAATELPAAAIHDALARALGRRARAAELLGVSRTTLWRRMRELGLA
jgi:transcriptional regulator with PAS, ATPase and Fis domain